MVEIKELKELAKTEVENIKKFATSREINRLDITRLDPDSHERCIYGLMTGSCETKRAMTLIINCCTKVLSTDHLCGNILQKAKLNGKPTKLKNPSMRLQHYVSPVESLIYRRKGAGEEIIAYLKGEKDTLEL